MRSLPLLLFLLLSAAPLAAAQNNHVWITEQNAPAVVAVNVAKTDGSTFTGTGFVLTPDGLYSADWETYYVLEDGVELYQEFYGVYEEQQTRDRWRRA